MKKFFGVFLCCVFLFICLTGCEKDTAAYGKNDDSSKSGFQNDGEGEYEEGIKTSDKIQAKALSEAKAFADAENYLDAIIVLEEYLRTQEDEGVTTKLYEYQNSYAEQSIQKARSIFIEPKTDYEKAESIINEALQKVPENADLKTEQEYYRSFAPMLLYDLGTYKRTTYLFKYVSDTDTYGNERYNAIRSDWHTQQSGSYDLSGKYNTFTATVYGRSNDDTVYYGIFEVYGDGACLYSNKNIAIDCRAFDISVDVTGVNDLKLVFDGQDYRAIANFGIAEAAVQKTKK